MNRIKRVFSLHLWSRPAPYSVWRRAAWPSLPGHTFPFGPFSREFCLPSSTLLAIFQCNFSPEDILQGGVSFRTAGTFLGSRMVGHRDVRRISQWDGHSAIGSTFVVICRHFATPVVEFSTNDPAGREECPEKKEQSTEFWQFTNSTSNMHLGKYYSITLWNLPIHVQFELVHIPNEGGTTMATTISRVANAALLAVTLLAGVGATAA